MSFSKISAVAGALAFVSKALAHGTVTGIVADGVYYEGYHANFQYMATQPVVVGWSIPEDLNNGFIAPDAYTSSDIICHLGATNAQTSATVTAGGTVQLQWTAWPTSHHGPVIDYLANCGGDCTKVDKTTLEFFKIDGVGLINDAVVPGTWASDQLIANNNTWTVTIPADIAPGNYVLRHEIIALHSAENVDGAQNYPQCVNLKVTGTGTATPSGVLGTALYTETDPGIDVNIYQSLSTYIVPGPTLYSGAISAAKAAGGSATVTAGTSAGTVPSVTSSSSAVVTSAAPSTASRATGGVTAVPSLSSHFPHFTNSTMTSSKKSACKAKSSSTFLAVLATSSVSVTAVATAPAASVTIPTTSPGVVIAASMTSSAATASETASGVSEPEGTTLDDILSWLSSFYKKYAGGSYSGSTVARRHQRALRV